MPYMYVVLFVCVRYAALGPAPTPQTWSRIEFTLGAHTHCVLRSNTCTTLPTLEKPSEQLPVCINVAEVAILVYGFDQGAASVPFALKSLNAAQPHLPTDPRYTLTAVHWFTG